MQESDSSRIAIHKHPELRVKKHDRIRAPLEQQLKHGGIILQGCHQGTGTFVPVASFDVCSAHEASFSSLLGPFNTSINRNVCGQKESRLRFDYTLRNSRIKRSYSQSA